MQEQTFRIYQLSSKRQNTGDLAEFLQAATTLGDYRDIVAAAIGGWYEQTANVFTENPAEVQRLIGSSLSRRRMSDQITRLAPIRPLQPGDVVIAEDGSVGYLVCDIGWQTLTQAEAKYFESYQDVSYVAA